MALDSKAQFSARLAALGLSSLQENFNKIGCSTIATFAFGANYAPKGDENVFLEEIVVPLTGDKKSILKPQIRRFFFECYTTAAAETNRRAEAGEDDAKPRKLPGPEREERFDVLKKRLSGLRLQEELEPSTLLVDKYSEMQDLGTIKILKWEEYTKRSQEEEGIKKDPYWAEDSDGRFKKFMMSIEETVKVSDNNLLAARYTLQRRGLAMNIANLLTFEVHELLIHKYFDEMAAEVLQGHAPVSLEQVRIADKAIFKRIGQETRGGFSKIVLEGEELPLDKLLKKLMEENRFQTLLGPYKLAVESKHRSEPTSGDKRLSDEVARLREENKRLKLNNRGNKDKGKDRGKGPSKDKGRGNQDPKGKGKGKGKGDSSRGPSMPKALHGMNPFVDGKRVCFDYNLSHGCRARGVEECQLGVHRCMYPGCGEDHGLSTCPIMARKLAKPW